MYHKSVRTLKHRVALIAVIVMSLVGLYMSAAVAHPAETPSTQHKTVTVDGIDIITGQRVSQSHR